MSAPRPRRSTNAVLFVRLTMDEMAVIERAAEAEGLPKTVYARRRLIEESRAFKNTVTTSASSA